MRENFYNCRANIPGIHLCIENEKITKSLLENIKVISHLNSFVDCNSSNKLNEEVKLNVLEQMLKLYIRVHSFSYVKDFTDKQKQHSSNQNKALRKGLKKTTSKPVIEE